jgi:hypothetical protein
MATGWGVNRQSYIAHLKSPTKSKIDKVFRRKHLHSYMILNLRLGDRSGRKV